MTMDFSEASQITDRQPDANAVVSFTGVVKWFNDIKGYGFITQADGRDILIHREVLRREGFYNVVETQKVAGTAFHVAAGLRAMTISLAAPVLEGTQRLNDMPRASTRPNVTIGTYTAYPEDIAENVPVTVRTYNAVRGWGFVVLDTSVENWADAGIPSCISIFLQANEICGEIQQISDGDRFKASVWKKAPKGNGFRILSLHPREGAAPTRPTAGNADDPQQVFSFGDGR
jgi:CspA family cold shock protein